MSVRLQDLEEKIKAKGYMVGGQVLTINESNKLLVNRVNVLERQLRDEQTKNKPRKQSPNNGDSFPLNKGAAPR
jgi:hypothetical protein